jgi:SET domain-containing protein
VFSASRDIEAGEELFTDYNEGKSKKKYWRKVDTLKRLGVPPERMVLCKCRSAPDGRSCPNNFAYDMEEMEGQHRL